MLDPSKLSRALFAVHPLDWCGLFVLVIVLALGIAIATIGDVSPIYGAITVLVYCLPLAVFLQALFRTTQIR